MHATVFYSEKFDYDSIRALSERACEESDIRKNDQVAVKVHFGEKGNSRFVSPQSIKPILDSLKNYSAHFFLTDANTLYRGMRTIASDHRKIALEHGFGALSAPIVIADGEKGAEEEQIAINKPIFPRVKIARRIATADVVIAISHFKGHMLFSFGGAIKNIGMGSGSRAGKLEMHSKIKPSVGASCLSCGQCVEFCPADAIDMTEGGRATIDKSRCIGCAKCISVCEKGAIEVPWAGASAKEVQERCAEYAFGVLKGKRRVCVTFINNISKDCDCLADTKLIGRDVGVVASTDPVACDQAAYDLVLEKEGKDIFKAATRVAGHYILDHAERIGLGVKAYRLVRL